MGYSSGKDCFNGECRVQPTLAKCVSCCSQRCPQWIDDCIDACAENFPSAQVWNEIGKSADLINSGHSISTVAGMMNVGFGTIQRATAGKVDPTITGGRHARKVVDDDVLRARRDITSGTATIREIADRLGISWPAAQKMVQGRTYRHVGEAVPEASGRREHTPEPCVVDGCAEIALARGHCTMHYNRLMTHGTPGPAQPHRAKLDEAKVRTIRQMRHEGARVKDIADTVGVGHSTVESVLAGRTWAHVT